MARRAMTTVSVRVTPDEADAVESAAREARLSMAAWIRAAMIEKLERDGQS